MKTLIATIIVTMLVSGEARAGVITTLYNTGIGADGLRLADGSVDPHYAMIQSPSGSGAGANAFVTDSTKYPISGGPWMADTSASGWVSPTADQSVFLTAGAYEYQTTFDLTGFDPSTATISGQWATDDAGTDILINGDSTGIVSTGDSQGNSFEVFTPFTIDSGFVGGINTLTFMVTNDPNSGVNPTGLRVELSGTADASIVTPEPSSLIIWATGAAIVVLRGRSRTGGGGLRAYSRTGGAGGTPTPQRRFWDRL